MTSKLHVAVVGCGDISDYHIRAWKKAHAKVVAICDQNVSLAESKARKWNIPKYYRDVSEMIARERLEVTSICTPAEVRSEVIVPVMESGSHIVVEKPFALSSAEAQRIIDLQRKYGVKLTVTHNWLFSHVMRKALGILKSGEMGDVFGAEIDVLGTPRNAMTSNPSHWCHSLRGGRFAEMLPHPLYTLGAVLGTLEVRYVSGSKLGNYNWMPIDELWVLLEGSNGRRGTIHASLNSARSEATLKVYASKGVLTANLYNQTLIKRGPLDIEFGEVARDNLGFLRDLISSNFMVAVAIITRQYEGMHTAFMKEFVKCLAENRDPPVTPTEAFHVTRIYEDLCSRIHSLYF